MPERTVLSRRSLLRLAFGSAAGALAARAGARGTAATGDTPARKPNIILILADDLGYGDLGCYGQKHIRTPVLDGLAGDGLKLDRFHAGFPVCLPSRCTLMTGLHTGHCRCRVNGGGGNHPMLAERDTTVAAVLRAAGYTTAMFGKWSLGDEFNGCVVNSKNRDGSGAIYKHGWDVYFGEPNQTYVHSYYLNQMYRYDRLGLLGEKTPPDRLVPVAYPGNSKKKEHYSHDLLTARALEFIDAAKDRPFFLYLPYTVPHPKYEIPELEPYAEKAPWSQKEKVHASMITRMDRDIGRIVERLRELGLERDTLVLFTSDNGAHGSLKKTFASNGGLDGGKGNFTPGGVRVPGIAWWPGRIAPGRTSDELLAFWDLLPTFAELAGIAPPAPIDGVSMVPTLLGTPGQSHHDYLFFRGGRPGDEPPALKRGRYLILRGKGESRTDAEIAAEAWSDVVVPAFPPGRRD